MTANPTPAPSDRDFDDREADDRDAPGTTQPNPTGVSTEAPAEGQDDLPGSIHDSPGTQSDG